MARRAKRRDDSLLAPAARWACCWRGADDKGEGLGEIIDIGLDHTFTAHRSGTLYLKVNDSPGELGDNLGTLLVHVVPASS